MAARIFLPVDAETDLVPAIIEYNPYRKRDLTAVNNEPFHGYLAGHGYAGVRLEIRVSAELGLSCTTTDFALAVRMAAREDETVVWTRDWDLTIRATTSERQGGSVSRHG